MIRRMKALIALTMLVGSTSAFACTTGGGCLSEVLYNPPTENSAADTPNEYVELRRAPSTSFPINTFFVVIEGDHTQNPGLVKTVFNLSNFAVGSNGYLVLLMSNHPYAGVLDPAAATSVGSGGATAGFAGIVTPTSTTQIDNGTNTFMLFTATTPAGIPTAGVTDIDTDDDGIPNQTLSDPWPNWSQLDSIAAFDAAGGDGADRGYGSFAFGQNGANYTTAPVNPGFNTPGYVGRAGDSTADTQSAWVVADNVQGTAPNFTLGPSFPPAATGTLLPPIGGPNFPGLINAAPLNTVPAAQITPEEVALVFSTASGNSISTSDPDAGSSAIRMTLTAVQGSGTLTLGSTAGLTVSGNGTAAITATGTIADINNALQGLTYAPNTNFAGSETLRVDADDLGNTGIGGARQDTDTVAITVSNINDTPVAASDSYSTTEDTTLNVGAPGVLGNDSDPDPGDTLTAVLVSGVATGTLTLAPNGGFSYVPAPGFGGIVSFTYKVNDGTVDSNTVTVTIAVTAVDELPTAANDAYSMIEDALLAVPAPGVRANDTNPDDGTTLTVTTAPANGTFTAGPGADGSFSYQPNANYSGGDSFVYELCDGDAVPDCASATVTLTISAVDENPTAVNDTLDTNEDSVLAVTAPGVLANDTNPDGGTTLTLTTGPVNGTLTVALANDGSFSYQPNANYFGSDGFTYRLCDGDATADCASATVTINVNAVDETPVATNDTFFTSEDSMLSVVAPGVLFNDTNGDGGTALAVTSGPANGTIVGELADDGSFTYLPNANYSGSDSFTYEHCDGDTPADCASATVTINITAVDETPTADADSFAANEDTLLELPAPGVLAGDVNPDGGTTLTVLSGPSNGTLTVALANDGSFSYLPNASFHGSDSFTYRLCDGDATPDCSAPATVTLTVTNGDDDPPVATAQAVTTNEDAAVGITLTGTDGDTPAAGLTFAVVAGSGPANGTLSGTGANRTYTPNASFSGSDSFMFTVSDATTTSAPATVSITVTNVDDDTPFANAQSVTTPEETAVSITLAGSDSDTPAGSLVFAVVAGSGPTNGTLSGTGPNLTYTPNANFHGSDSFAFAVSDGNTTSAPATVSITVTNGDNDTPVATPQSVTTNEETAVGITLAGTDSDTPAASFVFAVVTGPVNGTLTGTGANRTYTPNTNFQGSDSFTFTVGDGNTTSAPATVSITVNNVDNDTPLANAQSVTTPEDTAASITLTGSDSDTPAASLVFDVVAGSGPANGTLSGTGASLTYTPNASFSGSDAFGFTVSDGNTTSAPATVSITVTNGDDDTPIANAQSVTTPEDTAASITLTGSDSDTPAASLVFAVVAGSGPTHGTLTGTGANRTYTPNASFIGSDSFTFTVSDGNTTSTAATVSITVTNVDNDTPVANAQSVTTPEDAAVSIALTGSDSDTPAASLAYAVVPGSGPANGTLSGTAPNLTYTPNAGFSGSDSFTFTVGDGNTTSAAATVSITVANVDNDTPVANPQSVTTDEDTAAGITLTGTDSDTPAASLTFAVVAGSGPANGTLSGTAPNLTYTPNASFSGSDGFRFTVGDGTTTSAPATVSITVTNVDSDTPVANAQSVTTDEDTAVSITLTGSDSDTPTAGLTFAVVSGSGPASGTLSGTAPNLTYTPNASFSGSDGFTFTVSDGTTTSTAATVSITVPNGDNDTPVANAQSATTDEEVAVAITLTGSDSDTPAASLAFTVVAGSGPANGMLSGTAPDLTYTPNANFSGSDGFTFTVGDGNTTSAPATVSITVGNYNDAPVFTNGADQTRDEDSGASTVVGWATGIDDGDAGVSQALAFNVSVVSGASLFSVAPAVDATTGDLSYTLAANANGTSTISLTLSDDGSGTPPNADTSAAQTFTITVTAVNDAPVATSGTLPVTEDATATGTLAGTDVENDPLAFAVDTQGTKGVVTVTDPATGAYSYAPNANASGGDAFTFTANDGSLASAPATITVTIAAVDDDALSLADDANTAVEAGAAVDGNVFTNDQTGDQPRTLTAAQGATPITIGMPFTTAGGATLTLDANGTYTYLPPAQGQVPPAGLVETFTYTIVDADGDTDSATLTITVSDNDIEFPVVVSIERMDANPTTTSPVRFRITFSETVNGVGSEDLRLAATGSVAGQNIESMLCANTICTVTVGIVKGDGTLHLDLVDDDSIVDLAGRPLGGTGEGNGNFTGQAYTVDLGEPGAAIVPVVTSITRLDPTPTPGPTVRYAVTFSEAVTGVDASDFIVTPTGTLVGSAVGTVTGSGTSWVVTASTGVGIGTLRLDLVDDDSIRDTDDDRLGDIGIGNGSFTGQAYTVDTVNSIPIFKDGFEIPPAP